MESAAWGLIGTLIGAATSLLATYFTIRHTEVLSEKARQQERLDKFCAFQRETLLELQVALHDAIRNISIAHLEDCKTYASGIEWGKGSLPDQVSEDVRVTNSRVSICCERVADESVRSLVKQIMSEATSVLISTSKAEADKCLANVTVSAIKAGEVIGRTLRSTY